MGRLFDAVSRLLCLRHTTNYEGQAAIELEQVAERYCQQSVGVKHKLIPLPSRDLSLRFPIMGVSYAPRTFRAAVEDIQDGAPQDLFRQSFMWR